MNSRCFLVLLGMIISAFSMSITGCGGNDVAQPDAPDELQESTLPPLDDLPSLEMDDDEPLLLEEPAELKAASGADNQTCFVCHANYSEEPFAVNHALMDVGCSDCHGDSIAHKNDENNTTPPDYMFPSDEIAKLCKKCHDSHDVPANKVIDLWKKKGLDKTEPNSIVCTDCHGNHRLKIRTVNWNKKTRKLLQKQ